MIHAIRKKPMTNFVTAPVPADFNRFVKIFNVVVKIQLLVMF